MSRKREWTLLDEVHPIKQHTIKWYTDSPTHQGNRLGEEAYILAKMRAVDSMIGPEPFCGICENTIKEFLRPKEIKIREIGWDLTPGCTNQSSS